MAKKDVAFYGQLTALWCENIVNLYVEMHAQFAVPLCTLESLSQAASAYQPMVQAKVVLSPRRLLALFKYGIIYGCLCS